MCQDTGRHGCSRQQSGTFLLTRRQDRDKAKRNRDPSPERHWLAWPPGSGDTRAAPSKSPGKSLSPPYDSCSPRASADGARRILPNKGRTDLLPRAVPERASRGAPASSASCFRAWTSARACEPTAARQPQQGALQSHRRLRQRTWCRATHTQSSFSACFSSLARSCCSLQRDSPGDSLESSAPCPG